MDGLDGSLHDRQTVNPKRMNPLHLFPKHRTANDRERPHPDEREVLSDQQIGLSIMSGSSVEPLATLLVRGSVLAVPGSASADESTYVLSEQSPAWLGICRAMTWIRNVLCEDLGRLLAGTNPHARATPEQCRWTRRIPGHPSHRRIGIAGLREILATLAFAGILLAQRSPLDAAWDLVASGQTEKAVTLLDEFIRKDPQNGEARLLLGSLLAGIAKMPEAIAQLKAAVRLLPNSAEAHNTLGEAFNTANDVKQAREEFEKAVQLEPKLPHAQVNLGMVLAQAGELAPAAEHLDRAIELLGQTPDAALPLYLRAKVHTEEGQKDLAAKELSAAVRLKPDFVEAWSDLGQVRKAMLDDAGAFAAFQRAAELNPDNAVSQARLGSEYLHRKQPHEAVIHLQKALQLDPEDQTALFNLQLALRQDGQEEQARAIKERLAEVLRKKDETREKVLTATRLNNEGVDLEKAGDLRAAVEKYRAANELNPESNAFRVNFAVALLRLGRWKEGLAQMHECLRRDPDNPTLKSAWDDAIQQAPPGSWVEPQAQPPTKPARR